MRTPMNSIRRGMLATGAALIATPFGRTWAAGDIAGGKPITLVVSYPAGGGADVMARLIAPWLAETWVSPSSSTTSPEPAERSLPRRLRAPRPTGRCCCLSRVVLRRQPRAVRQIAL